MELSSLLNRLSTKKYWVHESLCRVFSPSCVMHGCMVVAHECHPQALRANLCLLFYSSSLCPCLLSPLPAPLSCHPFFPPSCPSLRVPIFFSSAEKKNHGCVFFSLCLQRLSLCSIRMAMAPSPPRSSAPSCAPWARTPPRPTFRIW